LSVAYNVQILKIKIKIFRDKVNEGFIIFLNRKKLRKSHFFLDHDSTTPATTYSTWRPSFSTSSSSADVSPSPSTEAPSVLPPSPKSDPGQGPWVALDARTGKTNLLSNYFDLLN